MRGQNKNNEMQMVCRQNNNKNNKTALIVVDVQHDFLPGGALGVPNGDEIFDHIEKEAKQVDVVFASRDWHPDDHSSFQKQGGIWPDHCVRGTHGAELHARTKKVADHVISKAEKQEKDSYSAFDDTSLAENLRQKDVDKVVIAGLATDYCVLATTLDALKEGFQTEVLVEGVRAVNLKEGDGARALEKMQKAGARLRT